MPNYSYPPLRATLATTHCLRCPTLQYTLATVGLYNTKEGPSLAFTIQRIHPTVAPIRFPSSIQHPPGFVVKTNIHSSRQIVCALLSVYTMSMRWCGRAPFLVVSVIRR